MNQKDEMLRQLDDEIFNESLALECFENSDGGEKFADISRKRLALWREIRDVIEEFADPTFETANNLYQEMLRKEHFKEAENDRD